MCNKKVRLYSIDRATGLAITLVVIGHVVAREPPAGNEWYVLLKYYLYKFHMPFFMFLSGTIFQYTFRGIFSTSEYFQWAKKKFQRLFPGFFIVGSVIIFGKIIASSFLHVDNLQTDIFRSYYLLLFMPKNSPAGSMWYIYVLLLMYLLVPVILKVLNSNMRIFVGISLIMHVCFLMFVLPRFMMIDAFFQYLFWFSLGMILLEYHDRFIESVKKYGVVYLLLFLLSFVLTAYFPEKVSKSIISFASIPAIFYITENINQRVQKMLIYISGYTFTIYLLNTLVIGLTKGVLLKVLPWDGYNFILYFVVLLTLGVYAPIFIHKKILVHNRFIAKALR